MSEKLAFLAFTNDSNCSVAVVLSPYNSSNLFRRLRENEDWSSWSCLSSFQSYRFFVVGDLVALSESWARAVTILWSDPTDAKLEYVSVFKMLFFHFEFTRI